MAPSSTSNSSSNIDPVAAESLLRCYYLADILTYCIVEDSYKPPVQLVTAISFTSRGKSLANHGKGDGVSLMESQLAAFLAMWAGDELLIDPLETKLDALRDAISSEIKRKKLRFPWLYGRMLYDAIADSDFHGSAHPSHEETIQLTDKLLQGVFQLGPYVLGPYGIIEAKEWRTIAPRTTVFGYHCDEIDCDRVHPVYLSTGESGVSKARELIGKKISRLHKQDTRYADGIIEISAAKTPPYSWSQSGTLPFFLFDCFEVGQIKGLLAALLNSNGAYLRSECELIGLKVGKAQDFVNTLDEASALQLLLLAKDSDIHSTLNRAIWSEEIKIPQGETRRTQVIENGSGPLGVVMEASSLGARFKPRSSLVQVRLRQIVDVCFPLNNPDAQVRLGWLLREYEGDSASSKLTNALSSESPSGLVKKLLVSSEISYQTVLQEIALPVDVFHNASDEELARLITWHVGFADHDESTELAKLISHISELKKTIRSLPGGQLDKSDLSRVRQLAGDLFVGLEEVLKYCLCFVAWAFLHDHYDDGYALAYSRGTASKFFSDWLNGRSRRIQDVSPDKMDLGQILECYGLVSQYLAAADDNPDSHRRPIVEWPRDARQLGSPFRFVFKHKLPYLDLDQGSRKHSKQLLSELVSSFNKHKVTDVRNGLLHHTEDAPDRVRIGEALDIVEARIGELASNGLYPLAYLQASSDGDSFGRRRYLLTSADGPEVVLTRPSSIDLAGFPALSHPQTVMLGARIEGSGEPLRFALRIDSEYQDRWVNFPRRPPSRSDYPSRAKD